MPLTNIVCCSGDECSVAECLGHAASRKNKCNFTAEMLASMYATVQERGERITTTALIAKCIRREHLTRNEPYALEPKSLWASFRGTMFHGQLERHVMPGSIEEPRYFVELPDLGELTGSPDLIDVSRGILYDYKNTGSIPRYGTPWSDHVEQLNINRWLVDNAYKVEHRGDIFDLTDPETRALYVPMDWQDLIVVYMDEKGPMPMRCTKSVQVPAVSGGTKNARVADIWEDTYAEEFIREHYLIAKQALVERILPDIPVGYEGQSHVLCGYCPVRRRCRELEMKELLTEHSPKEKR